MGFAIVEGYRYVIGCGLFAVNAELTLNVVVTVDGCVNNCPVCCVHGWPLIRVSGSVSLY